MILHNSTWTIFPLFPGVRSAITEAAVWRNEPHGQCQVVGPTLKLETFLTRKGETTEGYRAPRPLEVGTRTMHHDILKLGGESRSPSRLTALMYRNFIHLRLVPRQHGACGLRAENFHHILTPPPPLCLCLSRATPNPNYFRICVRSCLYRSAMSCTAAASGLL